MNFGEASIEGEVKVGGLVKVKHVASGTYFLDPKSGKPQVFEITAILPTRVDLKPRTNAEERAISRLTR